MNALLHLRPTSDNEIGKSIEFENGIVLIPSKDGSELLSICDRESASIMIHVSPDVIIKTLQTALGA